MLQFIILLLSALTIGAVFGIFVLQLSQEDDKSVSSEVKQETGSKTSIPGISFYVVQAGLFADRANAEQVQANLTSKKGVAAIWQDKEEFYLFTGLANSEEKEIGRASCRERVERTVVESGVKEKEKRN